MRRGMGRTSGSGEKQQQRIQSILPIVGSGGKQAAAKLSQPRWKCRRNLLQQWKQILLKGVTFFF